MTTNLENFLRIVTERSNEHTSSIFILHQQSNYGTCIGLLRQELDSLIRVCYLNTLLDIQEIESLIADTINGAQWKKDGKRITDRKMVEIASLYNHWAPEVYEFGNNFIHLTNFSDYKNIDPLRNFDQDHKLRIRQYLSQYHFFPTAIDITFENVAPYIPQIAKKVSDNLKSYLSDLAKKLAC